MKVALHGRKKNCKEKLRELLAEWRQHEPAKAQVAERMGVAPPVISRLENHQQTHGNDIAEHLPRAIAQPVIALY
jgi:transcriptional regulator with XRE-family HTH domain